MLPSLHLWPGGWAGRGEDTGHSWSVLAWAGAGLGGAAGGGTGTTHLGPVASEGARRDDGLQILALLLGMIPRASLAARKASLMRVFSEVCRAGLEKKHEIHCSAGTMSCLGT